MFPHLVIDNLDEDKEYRFSISASSEGTHGVSVSVSVVGEGTNDDGVSVSYSTSGKISASNLDQEEKEQLENQLGDNGRISETGKSSKVVNSRAARMSIFENADTPDDHCEKCKCGSGTKKVAYVPNMFKNAASLA